MPNRLEFVPEGPYGYLVEEEPIQIAAVLAARKHPGTYSTKSEHFLLDCVVLNPKYASPGMDTEILTVRGRRKGRTIDIMLDEPIEVCETGETFRVLTFKGSGAFPTGRDNAQADQWIIDSAKWHSSIVDPLGRYWGACKERSAIIEATKDTRPYLTHVTPYLSANVIPEAVLKNISPRTPESLAQSIRLTDTNILPEDALWRSENPAPWEEQLDRYCSRESLSQNLFSVVIALAEANRQLRTQGRMIQFGAISPVFDNVYVSGRIKDLENIHWAPLEGISPVLKAAYNELLEAVRVKALQSPTNPSWLNSWEKIQAYVLQD
ncbi:MAG: hypothetical protein AABX70_07395 [Nanoarchaeota archaeon]